MPEYKSAEDFVDIKTVPEEYTGYDNPYVEVTLKRPVTDFQKKVMRICIAEAILRYSALTGTALKQEIKQ